MDRLDIGKLWLGRFNRHIPDASTRMTTRMAWHLAALSIETDSELAALPTAALSQFHGGTKHFIELRSLYLNRISAPVPSGVRLVRRIDQLAAAS